MCIFFGHAEARRLRQWRYCSIRAPQQDSLSGHVPLPLSARFWVKGYSTSDADLNQLATVLGHLVTSDDIQAGLITIPFASSIAFNAAALCFDALVVFWFFCRFQM